MEKVASVTYSDADSVGGMNELQDEILVLILSKLTMKEAARTSVLSHRWKQLWIYYTGSLNFDSMDAIVNILLKNTREDFERRRFISWVNQVLNLHRGQTVDEFRILFDLDECFAEDIERWIKFAVEKKVSRFELDFSMVDGFTKTHKYCYPFPSELLYLPGGSTSFGSLVTLRLNSVDLSDEVLTSFILNCQSLEHLSVKGTLSLTCLKATTALKLKHLEIEYCLGLRIVEVAYTNIESLRFVGTLETWIHYWKLPLLSEVSFGGTFSYFVLESRFLELPISQLQTLQLHLDYWVNFGWGVFPERFPTLLNLKYLEVRLAPGHDQSIFCLTSLIYASPLLSRFTLKVRYQKPRERKRANELPNCHWRKAEKHAHQCLKVVEFIGWNGQENDLELVSYLIENAPLLEKVIIDPRIPVIEERDVFRGREKESEEASRICAKQLEEKIRPGTELVIL